MTTYIILSKAKHDAWAWIGFILGDLYLFVMLVHASITWMPQTLASAERAKYSPLDSADLVFDDDDGSIWVSECVNLFNVRVADDKKLTLVLPLPFFVGWGYGIRHGHGCGIDISRR